MSIESLLSLILPKLVDRAAEKLVEKSPLANRAILKTQESQAAVSHHLRMLHKWSSEISFRDLSGPKSMGSVFVDLDLRLGLPFAPEQNRLPKLVVSSLVDLPASIVLVGDPGSGKSTSLKKLALSLLEDRSTQFRGMPLLVRLRDFSKDDTLSSVLMRILGVSVWYPLREKEDKAEHILRAEKATLEKRLLVHYLDRLSAIILVDGLDEISYGLRQIIVAEIRELVLAVSEAKIILTCRTADYVYAIDNMRVVALQPLSDEQTNEFAYRWLGNERAPVFLMRIRENPYSGTEIRPLTLAHLCAIYERSGTIPAKPKTVYRKIVRLLLEEWDQQRSILRESRYAGFEVDRKEEFLEALAYNVTAHLNATRFTHEHLESIYRMIHRKFGLPESEATKVVREIESHTGLVSEVAYNSYEFSHKSIQEYLAASFIVKLPQLPPSWLHKMPNEAAIAVALSSNSTEYCTYLLAGLAALDHRQMMSFAEVFVRRLQVEKVDFIVSKSLGLAILSLYTSTFYPNYSDPDRNAGSTMIAPPSKLVFLKFMREEVIADSIAEALAECTAVQAEVGRVRASPRLPGFSHALQKIHTLILDDEMLDALSERWLIETDCTMRKTIQVSSLREV